ncbi:MAG: hypothetical protein P4L93_09585 [Coriobacteriia bacterium]|nr:hypothetical protein [Coriobacteriia bacterium]
MTPTEEHHVAGRHNDERTMTVDANDHRELSDMQREWPDETLRNPDSSPMLTIAAIIRGFVDLVKQGLIFLEPLPAQLEARDREFRATIGPRYWVPCGEEDGADEED